MPATVPTVAPPPGAGPAAPGAAAAAPQPLVPFTRAAMRKTEHGNLDVTFVPSATGTVTTIDVPASGFLRAVWLKVEATGGTGTAAVYKDDAPWSLIESIVLRDINGAPIYGPVGGYEWYLTNFIGGYTWIGDPKLKSSVYTAPTTAGNFKFSGRVPVELRARDALGSLPNMNAAANYQLEITWAPKAQLYSTDPTGLPNVRCTAVLETWTNPNTHNALGQPQATQPPVLGTTQFWSRHRVTVSTGVQTVQLKRVGNLIRNVIVIGRTTAGVRSDDVLPQVPSLSWDTRSIRLEPLDYHKSLAQDSGVTLPAGVMMYNMNTDFDGHLGGELNDQWWQTVQSARIELGGTNLADGTLTFLTNDVVPAGNVWS